MRLPFLLVFAFAGSVVHATEPSAEAFFESKVRPVLVTHCYSCHAAAPHKIKGGLALDTRAGWATGGDSGPAIVPGQPDASLLIKAIRYTDESMRMPPKGKLPAETIAVLEEWVRQGAVDPRQAPTAEKRTGMAVAQGKEFWSFQPLKVPARPAVRTPTWSSHVVDQFTLARMEANGVQPGPDAEPLTWLRRVAYDLTGLPPSAADRAEVLRAPAVATYERIVERYLASPQFGEKWGRHWLDVARYADSNGSSFNPPFREAWRYRNWVIAAVNADMPYDRFVTAQIAGDLLPAATSAERDANMIATGYLMFGSKVLGQFDKPTLFLDVVDEQLDTIGKGLLGLTLGCARCHDHKFDPVPQRDYYALAGILASTQTLAGPLDEPKADENDWSRRGLGPTGDAQLARFTDEQRWAWVKSGVKAYQAQRKVDRLRHELAERPTEPRQHELAQAEAEWTTWQQKYTALNAQLPPLALAPRELAVPRDEPLRIRGVASSPGAVVPRGFLQVAAYPGQPQVNPTQSGRLELARWIASPQHPLTARVHVNRVWAHLFGEGLVRSVDNFGIRGERPTHPELLDYLAHEFITSGWRLKPLVRTLVLSRTYRLASTLDATNAAVDADNRWLSRHQRRRLTPEELRDTLLDVAGQLDRSPGTSLIDHLPLTDLGGADAAHLATLRDQRRTIYQPVIRNLLDDVLEVFDFANPSMSVSRRPRTTVAPQALYLLNSPFVTRTARTLADQVVRAVPERNPAAIVTALFTTCVQRPPRPTEQAILLRYLQAQYEGPGTLTTRDVSKLAHALLASTQFQYVD
jgi:hypothetical protein